jgi:hydrogenase-4 membrane subunit HyfE
MTQAIRLLLLFEVATFVVAALIHRGHIVEGYGHVRAYMAESVIAAVLFGGLLLSLFMPVWTRKIGVVVQGFAILGTLVGIFTIVVGVGPRTVPDVVYHIAMIVVLVVGFVLARSVPAGADRGYD